MVAKIVKAMKSADPATSSLKYHLHNVMREESPGRAYGRIHASSLMTKQQFCPREHVLGMLTKTVPWPENLTASTRLTFDLGNILQERVTNYAVKAGVARGNWKCQTCGHVSDFGVRPSSCHTCGNSLYAYVEPVFASKEVGIVGHIDLLIDLGTGKLKIVETKTISQDDFKTLQGPLGEHRWRTNLYMRLADAAMSEGLYPEGSIDTQEAIVIYISKGGYGVMDPSVVKWGFKGEKFSPFKEFLIARSDEDTEEKWQHAKMVRDWRMKKAGIPLGICATAFTQRAKGCQMCNACFSGSHPASV